MTEKYEVVDSIESLQNTITRVRKAQEEFSKFSQEKVDQIFKAAAIAAKAQPKELWLTHYSPSLIRPEEYIRDMKKIFPRIHTAKDGRTVELEFEEE